MFAKVLVANRGEIALRIFRTLRELGIGVGRRVLRRRPRRASRRRTPTRRYALGGPTAAESYLVVDKLLEAAARSGAEAVHPGLRLPRRERGVRARGRGRRPRLDRAAAGGDRADGLEDARAPGDAGGRRADHPRHDRPGRLGRGGRRARRGDRLPAADQGGGRRRRQGDEGRRARPTRRRRRSSRRSAKGSRTSPTPRSTSSATSRIRATSRCRCSPTRTGTSIHLGERDCTIQRRHQKLVEETPSPAVDAGAARADRRRSPSTPRARPATARRGRSRACSRPDGSYYFMEMNTRIQVEHTVTELVTGVDLVREQVQIAAGRAAIARARRTSSCAATRSSAASTPRIRRSGFLPSPGADHALPRAVRARACASTRASTRGLGDRAALRPDDREADRARHRPRARAAAACCARSASSRSAA